MLMLMANALFAQQYSTQEYDASHICPTAGGPSAVMSLLGVKFESLPTQPSLGLTCLTVSPGGLHNAPATHTQSLRAQLYGLMAE